jgi:hypothetical protein
MPRCSKYVFIPHAQALSSLAQRDLEAYARRFATAKPSGLKTLLVPAQAMHIQNYDFQRTFHSPARIGRRTRIDIVNSIEHDFGRCGVRVHIVHFLAGEIQGHKLHRVAVLLPNLVVGVVGVVLARIAERTEQPLPTALRDGLHGLDDFLRGVLLEIPDDARQWLAPFLGGDHEVHVAWHDDKGMHDQSFVCLAIAK